jgi:uncharacterized protein (DUF3084 family)
MKKPEIITLIVALAILGAFFGGMKLSGRQKESDKDKITSLESQIKSKAEALEEKANEASGLEDKLKDAESNLTKLSNERDQNATLISQLQADLDKTKKILAQNEEKEKQRQAGVAAAPKNAFAFSDPRGAVTVEVLQVLTGEQTVAQAKYHKHSLDGIREQGKELIYFEVKITNNKYDGELDAEMYHFKLESVKGDTFSVEQTRDYIRGDLHQGRSARGGIAFAVYTDSAPKILRYNTGLTDGLGNKLEAVSPDLRGAFQNK